MLWTLRMTFVYLLLMEIKSGNCALGLPLEVSCHDFCGGIRPGCSCDHRCLVLRNCCEDFEIQCQKLANESRAEYGHMMSAKVTCTSDGVFIIHECSKHDQTKDPLDFEVFNYSKERISLVPESDVQEVKQDNQNMSCWEETRIFRSAMKKHIQNLKSMSKNREGRHNLIKILRALAKRLVSDKTTGFLYGNLEAFNCYARPGSEPCLWTLYTTEDGSDLFQIAQNMKSLTLYNAAPESKSMPLNSAPVCYYHARYDCSKKSKFFSEKLQNYCLKHTSLVTYNLVTYRNRHCLLCIEGVDEMNYMPMFEKPKFIVPEFATMVSLSGNDVVLDRASEMVSFWRSAKCHLNESKKCQVTSCARDLVFTQDGDCKSIYELNLAVVIEKRSLDEEDRRQLGHYFACEIKQRGILEFISSDPPVLVIYQLNDNTTLYGIKATVYHTTIHDIYVVNEIRIMAENIGIPLSLAISKVYEKKTKADTLFSMLDPYGPNPFTFKAESKDEHHAMQNLEDPNLFQSTTNSADEHLAMQNQDAPNLFQSTTDSADKHFDMHDLEEPNLFTFKSESVPFILKTYKPLTFTAIPNYPGEPALELHKGARFCMNIDYTDNIEEVYLACYFIEKIHNKWRQKVDDLQQGQCYINILGETFARGNNPMIQPYPVLMFTFLAGTLHNMF